MAIEINMATFEASIDGWNGGGNEDHDEKGRD